MKTIALGQTGAQVSVMCLGAMRFGTTTPRETSLRLLDRYVEAGGSFIDTANIYARWAPGGKGGESETLLGQWMRERGNRRRLFIASKVGFEYPGVERGLRAEQIRQECDKSLRRMGIDTIDLYYAHVDDRATPLDEALGAFDALAKAGKVRWVGASNYSAWRLAEAECVARAHGWQGYCCVQQRHSYVRPRPGATFSPQVAANGDLLDYCKARNVTPLAYSPLLAGAYTRPDRKLAAQYLGPDTDARLAALNALAREKNATPNQIVLAWMMRGDPPVIPVFAVSTDEQMAEDLGSVDVDLTAEDLARLHEAGA